MNDILKNLKKFVAICVDNISVGGNTIVESLVILTLQVYASGNTGGIPKNLALEFEHLRYCFNLWVKEEDVSIDLQEIAEYCFNIFDTIDRGDVVITNPKGYKN